MPLSKSAVAWAVSGTLGIGTCALGFAALNSGAPANADPRPAITVGAAPQATSSAGPTATPTPTPSPTTSASVTASTAPTARTSVTARTPRSPATPVSPPSPRSADSGD